MAYASQPKPASQVRAPNDPSGSSRTNLLAAIVIGVLAVVLGFLAGRFNPLMTGATSTEGVKVDDLFSVLLGIGTAIFVVVQGALLYSIVRFRHKAGDDDDAPARAGEMDRGAQPGEARADHDNVCGKLVHARVNSA